MLPFVPMIYTVGEILESEMVYATVHCGRFECSNQIDLADLSMRVDLDRRVNLGTLGRRFVCSKCGHKGAKFTVGSKAAREASKHVGSSHGWEARNAYAKARDG